MLAVCGTLVAPEVSETAIIPAQVASLPLPVFTNIAVGERAEFTFTWLGLTVSHGEIVVKERLRHQDRDVWHVVLNVRTTRVLDLLFPMRDEYHSFIDVETFQSLRFEKNVHEGSYRADEVVEFDHEKKVGHYFSRLNSV